MINFKYELLLKDEQGQPAGNLLFETMGPINDYIAKLNLQPSQYEVVDMDLDPVWVAKKKAANKKLELPSQEEMLEALWESIVDNKPGKLNAVKAQIAAVNAKYPGV